MQKLPIDISTFSELRRLNYLYVDKTKYLYDMITGGRRYFLSRPRRFGKSLLVSTLKEILSGHKELFDGLWINQSDYDWQEHGIIDLDFSTLKASSLEVFKTSLIQELSRIARYYQLNINSTFQEPDFLLKEMVYTLYDKYGWVAILIDEYDSQILKTLNNEQLATKMRDEIQQFFTTIKSLDAYIHFVFITGVSSFTRAGLFSGINNLQIMTLDKHFAAICGYTEEEIDTYFEQHINNWANKNDTPYNDLRTHIKDWYNGYSFGYNVTKVYNPFSLMKAIRAQEFENFWFQSGAPTFLVNILKKDHKKFDPEHLEISRDMLDVFDVGAIPLMSLMFQAGYLTIVGYNPHSQVYKLSYPDLEVKKSLQKYLVEVFTRLDVESVQAIFSQLYDSFESKNIARVIELLKQLFAHIPYQLHMKEEKYYHSLLMMICIGAGIKAQSEFSTEHGRIDLVIEFEHILYIIEIKFNDTAENAFAQIEERKYYQRFLACRKQIILLGVSFIRKPHNFDIKYVEKIISTT